MVSQQQYYTQAPFYYHQTPPQQQQHGAGDNTSLHLTGGLETLQRALQYNSTSSHTSNGNFGGVLEGKHRVIIPLLKSWNLISSWTDNWMECQIGRSCLQKQ
jgi:hypothetical protein